MSIINSVNFDNCDSTGGVALLIMLTMVSSVRNIKLGNVYSEIRYYQDHPHDRARVTDLRVGCRIDGGFLIEIASRTTSL